jgi:hypothetical protein
MIFYSPPRPQSSLRCRRVPKLTKIERHGSRSPCSSILTAVHKSHFLASTIGLHVSTLTPNMSDLPASTIASAAAIVVGAASIAYFAAHNPLARKKQSSNPKTTNVNLSNGPNAQKLPHGAWVKPRVRPEDLEGTDIRITQLWVHPIKVSSPVPVHICTCMSDAKNRVAEDMLYKRPGTHPLDWRCEGSPSMLCVHSSYHAE